MIKAKDGFILRKLADEYMIIAIGAAADEFRDILQTNETGAFYWGLLKKGTTYEELVAQAMARFDGLDEATAKKDISEFLEDIRDAVNIVE